MRIFYIRFLSIFVALALCGCSELAAQLKQPHSLSSRVGNYSPTRINSDKGEKRAQTQITVLKKGIRDLDGRQESYDPAFGSPDRVGESTRLTGTAVKPVVQAPVTSGGPTTNGQAARFSAIASVPLSNNQSLIASSSVTPGSEIAQFGVSESGQPATTFRSSVSTTPIVNTPRPVASPTRIIDAPRSAAGSTPIVSTPLPVGNQGGFGCPPSGMTSLNNSMERNSSFTPSGASGRNGLSATGAQFASNPSLQPFASTSSIKQQAANPSKPQPAANSILQSSGGLIPFGQRAPTSMSSAGVQPGGSSFQSYSTQTSKDGDVIAAQSQRANGVNIVVTARVKRLLPDDRKGNPHQRFLLQLSNGTSVLVAHNIDLAPYVPLHENDMVTISGEYIWNEQGGVIHYTHRPTNFKHKGGYIDFNRQIYQ
ncbi:MAG: DUF3465 domain-containing protein [Candidatus Obscuribacterales bacterium]|nr:DUF3465 domain-containing protein [Candidatus Obscuribacterales bacterium]